MGFRFCTQKSISPFERYLQEGGGGPTDGRAAGCSGSGHPSVGLTNQTAPEGGG